jgi:integrase
LPLIALFSGARLEELAQLRVGDLANVHGLGCYLNITDEGEGSQLKTKNARRRVPVHPELEALGFLAYWKSCRKEGREFVFPDLKPDVAGKRSGNWSKWFGRYKRDIGIADKRKVFHSFRHGFIDACRAAGVQTEVRDVLVGHANDSVAAEYGEGNYPRRYSTPSSG